jgi:hypothetical protein
VTPSVLKSRSVRTGLSYPALLRTVRLKKSRQENLLKNHPTTLDN